MPTRPDHDPRNTITPDAFEVAPELLGMPLASPGRRLAAMLIDAAVIGGIYAATRSFALLLGVAASVFFIRAGLKRTEVRGSVFNRAMRFSVGCLGVGIGLLTAIAWVAFGYDFSPGGKAPDTPLVQIGLGSAGREAEIDLADIVSGLSEMRGLQDADSATAAAILGSLAGRLAEQGMDELDIEDLLTTLVPDESVWSPHASAMIAAALSGGEEAPEDAPPAPAWEGDQAEALRAYLDLVSSGDTLTDDKRSSLLALRLRLAPVVAADTLRSIRDALSEAESDRRRLARDLEATREALEEASKPRGFFSQLLGLADELGFGFGWATLYMTVMLSWWNGQTIGKRLLGVRVVRLDGGPITWWVAFERAGGYAAGLATGLLGFAQVYWDANRQAVHDRIVGTVVVDARATNAAGAPTEQAADGRTML